MHCGLAFGLVALLASVSSAGIISDGLNILNKFNEFIGTQITFDDLHKTITVDDMTQNELVTLCDLHVYIAYKRDTNNQLSTLCNDKSSSKETIISYLKSKSVYSWNKWYLNYLMKLNGVNNYKIWENDPLTKLYIEETVLLPDSEYAYVNTDNLKIYYRYYHAHDLNETCRPPVVLLGGWSTPKEDWRDVAPYMNTFRDILTVDIRGVGETGLGPTSGNYTAEQIATDINDLVKQVFPGQKPVLVGGALGGKITIQSTLTYPNDYSGFGYCATTAGGTLESRGPRWETFKELMLSGEYTYSWYQLALCIYSEEYVEDNYIEWIWRFISGGKFALSTEDRQEGVNRQSYIADDYDVSDLLSNITSKILVLHGSEDQIENTESGSNLANATNNANNAIFEELTGEGHAFWHQDETEFITDVTKWLYQQVDPC